MKNIALVTVLAAAVAVTGCSSKAKNETGEAANTMLSDTGNTMGVAGNTVDGATNDAMAKAGNTMDKMANGAAKVGSSLDKLNAAAGNVMKAK
jgi:hypothetical protein